MLPREASEGGECTYRGRQRRRSQARHVLRRRGGRRRGRPRTRSSCTRSARRPAYTAERSESGGSTELSGAREAGERALRRCCCQALTAGTGRAGCVRARQRRQCRSCSLRRGPRGRGGCASCCAGGAKLRSSEVPLFRHDAVSLFLRPQFDALDAACVFRQKLRFPKALCYSFSARRTFSGALGESRKQVFRHPRATGAPRLRRAPRRCVRAASHPGVTRAAE